MRCKHQDWVFKNASIFQSEDRIFFHLYQFRHYFQLANLGEIYVVFYLFLIMLRIVLAQTSEFLLPNMFCLHVFVETSLVGFSDYSSFSSDSATMLYFSSLPISTSTFFAVFSFFHHT